MLPWVDHGLTVVKLMVIQSWSTMVKLTVIHSQFKVMLFQIDHGRPWSNGWSCCSGLTMVDHGLTMVKLLFHGQFKVMLFWVDHGQIDGHFMVSSRSCFLV